MTTAVSVEKLEARLAEADTDAGRLTALNALVWEVRTIDRRRALALSEEAVCLARALGDPASLAASLCLRGVCAGLLSRHGESAQFLEEALTLSRSAGDPHTEARCLKYLGRVQFCLADYGPALETVAASLQIYEALNDDAGRGACFSLMGLIHFHLCDYAQALDWHTQGLAVREAAGDEFGVAESLSNIGIVYLEMEDYGQARDCHERSLASARRLERPRLEMLSLCNLSNGFVGMRRFAEAGDAARQALALAEALDIRETLAPTLQNLGHAHAGQGEPGEALDCFRRALDAARAIDDHECAAEILCARGALQAAQGELTWARASLVEAAALARPLGARRTVAEAARELAAVCRRQGDYPAALAHSETYRRTEREIFTQQTARRAQAVAFGMEVEHHRREAAALAEANAALQEANLALQAANARLESLATTDPLTGLPNHRALVAALDAEIAGASGEGGRCGLLFLDIDHFKCVNDTYGHSVGDSVLREFAARVRSALRPGDTLGRWGGEEFLVVLLGVDAAGAQEAGERVRAAVAERPLLAEPELCVTCSVGVAVCPPRSAVRAALVDAADAALYAAKRLGRNRVHLAGAVIGEHKAF